MFAQTLIYRVFKKKGYTLFSMQLFL